MASVSVDINIDYQFILFVLFAIMVCSTAPVYFYNRSKYFAGFISLILFILVFVFFGMRWFSGSEMVGPGAGYKGVWPPQIAVCPDYLTYYESGTTKGCYNANASTLGVSTSFATGIKTSPTATTGSFITPYTKDKTKEQLKELCDSTITAGLSWEGITNGDSCTF